MSKVLALDQAMKVSGWAVYNNDKLEKYGSFSIPANKPIEERLYAFWKHLNELRETYGEFDRIIFEDIQYQNNAETYKKLAYCQAALILWCHGNMIKFNILSPSHWRSVLKDKFGYTFGKTRSVQKEQAQKIVKDKFQIEATEDECDAICLGLAAQAERQQRAF